ncbi:E3 ubiquitin-protein ligase makorin isoform X1 [Physcomitrium patens]|uniref:RING-type E3 ubiquitin transferase n=2 Tax=Physcomitrium patens TaxID=3218 RepID=A0A2K1KL26_PHYPA|nr:E3 ubiquitin-protein ligase makorin-like isoform X1 [Physcomitrium patens]PNR54482.1 hypothetical protein PHYPA_008159 [Physcomitrium patens]|eukprot:XP_024375821.1 E3 ubiquitin-protein ligase makorin-like isoform X1 [Physcomitrella patens]
MMEGRSRVLCKFFMHGACLKGVDCQFSHNWSDQSSQVCTFYQRGLCSYGARCRYEHVKVSRLTQPLATPVPVPRHLPAAISLTSTVDSSSRATVIAKPSLAHLKDAWQQNSTESLANGVSAISLGEADEPEALSNDPSDRPICAFAAAGNCPLGESCRNIHGDLCTTCGKHCLHPYRPLDRENHKIQCERNKKNLEALLKSQDIECSICLERVLSKPTVAERKFGLMSGCDHPFCVGCIRGWRSGSHAPGMDIDTVVRACPVCRVPTHYVVPSVVWYFSPEEKEEIINGYKNKLGEVDCRHFDYGNGTCPFGTSCFYKHAFKDGTLEEVKLRHLGAADGNTVIVKNVRLSDFLKL